MTKTPSTRARAILLVEDDKEMATEIESKLKALGYLVRTASIAEAADADRPTGLTTAMNYTLSGFMDW